VADPSVAEVQSQTGNLVKILDVHRLNMGVSAGNYLSREDTFIQSLETNFGNMALAALQGFRGDMNSAIRRASSMIEFGIREYGRLIGAPETDLASILRRLYT